ncbi:MAG: protein-disulfide reductase DsbD domain-containing protein [Chitinophagaceae bacterium]
MKRNVLFFLVLSLSLTGFAQNSPEPVKWSFTAKKIADKKYEVHLTATIEREWHIYSQTTPDGGPVATTITFAANPLASMDGAVAEVGKLEKHFEDLFGVEVKQFSDKVDFVQVVVFKANVKTNISGTVKFMVCNDKMCLPPKSLPFSIALK